MTDAAAEGMKLPAERIGVEAEKGKNGAKGEPPPGKPPNGPNGPNGDGGPKPKGPLL